MDYFFYLYISDKCLQFRKKSILIWAINFIIKSITKGIEILAKRLISFSIIVFSMKFLVILFIRQKKYLLKNIFGSPHTGNWIYLLQNFFKLGIPQRHVHNLERYWKNSVCFRVKNFANL